MKRPGMFKDVKKAHATAKKVLQHGVGNSVWPNNQGKREVGICRKKLSRGERKEEKGIRLFGPRGLAELQQVASDLARQN